MVIGRETVLGVILARGGSKRVPRKNLRDFQGKPLLVWAMEQAQESRLIDEFFVSTDDAEIACLARAWNNGDDIVIERPPELATDEASSEDALRHALAAYPHHWVVLLQPTSPLRTAADIDACIERAQMGNGCVSVGFDRHPNGAVYVARAEWIAEHDFSHAGLMKYVMPEERSLDINVEADFAA